MYRRAIRAHYDGKVIVPDEPLKLPCDQALLISIEPVAASASSTPESALTWLANNAAGARILPPD